MGGDIYSFLRFGQKESETSRLSKKFANLIDFIKEMMIYGDVEYFYINTNLLYKTDILWSMLSAFDSFELIPRIRFTTSYDFKYRFGSVKDEEKFMEEVWWLRKEYPDMPLVVNTILTDYACDCILEKTKLNYVREKMNHPEINFIPYITLHGCLAPTREKLQRTLLSLENEQPGFLKAYVDNLALPQKKILYEYNAGKLEYATSPDAECGHNINFQKVYGSDNGINHHKCYICDCINLLKTIGA